MACNAQVADPLAHPFQRIWGVWEPRRKASAHLVLQTADLAAAAVLDPPLALHPAAAVAVRADPSLNFRNILKLRFQRSSLGKTCSLDIHGLFRLIYVALTI